MYLCTRVVLALSALLAVQLQLQDLRWVDAEKGASECVTDLRSASWTPPDVSDTAHFLREFVYQHPDLSDWPSAADLAVSPAGTGGGAGETYAEISLDTLGRYTYSCSCGRARVRRYVAVLSPRKTSGVCVHVLAS